MAIQGRISGGSPGTDSALAQLIQPGQEQALAQFLNIVAPEFKNQSPAMQARIIKQVQAPPQLPTAIEHPVMRAYNANEFYNPLQRIGNALGGAAAGVAKGIIPSDNIQAPNGLDPATQMSEAITRTPTALLSNIVGAVLTGGAYNAAYSGIDANSKNRTAQADALRAGQWEAARNIRDANVPATMSGAAYGLVTSRLPGHLGKNILAKIGAGAAMGYGMDLTDQAVHNYAVKGKLNAKDIHYAPGLNTVLGAGIPAGIHYAPQVAQSVRAGAGPASEYIGVRLFQTAEKVGAGLEKLNRRARTGHAGHIRFGKSPEGLPLQGDYQRGVTERQYAGQMTGDIVPMTSTHMMQQEAAEAVGKAIDMGQPESLQAWVQYFQDTNEPLKANAVLLGALEPDNLARLPESLKQAVEDMAQQEASGAGRNLQMFQNNPVLKARNEFLEAASQDKPHTPGKNLNAAGDDVRDLLEAEAKKLLQFFIDAAEFAAGKADKKAPRAPRKVKATEPKVTEPTVPKEVKPRGPKPFRLRVKTINETKIEADQLAQRRKRLQAAIEKESKREKPNGERVVQLKLALGAIEKRADRIKLLLARALTEDPTKPLAAKATKTQPDYTPEEQAVLDFAKARLRAKAHIRSRLNPGVRKPIVREPFKFTTVERELIEKLDAAEKAARENTLKLRVKRVKEITADDALRKNREALQKAYDKDLKARRNAALAEIRRFEKKLNPQLKLNLQVKREAQRLTSEVMAALSPEEQAYLLDMYHRDAKAHLFASLERRLAAGERTGVKNKPETLAEMFARLEPSMTDKQRSEYKQRMTDIGRRRFLSQLRSKEKALPEVKRTLLDRVVQAHDFGLLSAATPDVLDRLIGNAKKATIRSSEDWTKLNAFIAAATDPTLTVQGQRRADALLGRFIYDHQSQNLFAKWISFRTEGLLLQGITQARNYIDAAGAWAYYKFPGAGLRELGEFAYSRLYKAEYDAPNKRSLIIRISKETKEFFKQNEMTTKQELENIFYDIREGTNTSRNRTNNIFKPGGLPDSFMHTDAEGKVADLRRGIDKKVGGTIRAILSSGDRLVYTDIRQHALSKEIEIYKRAYGHLPDPKSEVYKKMGDIATDVAEQVGYTNNGVVTGILRGTQKLITDAADNVYHELSGKTDSLKAGGQFIAFPAIPGNLALRPLENVPVIGAGGIYLNRLLNGKGLTGNARYQSVVAGQIFAAQVTGLAMTYAGGSPMMYYAGYYGAFAVPKKDKVRAVEEYRQDAGIRRGSINTTAFQRYFASGNPEDFIAQEGDKTLYTFGLNNWSMPMLYMTAPGREDHAQGREPEPRQNPIQYPGNTIKGVADMFMQNDSLSGVTRPITQFKDARDPETNEPSIPASVNAVASNFTSFKLPGADLFPQVQRHPENAIQQYERGIPFVDQLVPEALDVQGNVKQRQGLFGEVAKDDTFASYMNDLRVESGKTSHLLGSFPRKISLGKDDDNGQPMSINLPEGQRAGAEADVKKQYVQLVAQVRNLTLPNGSRPFDDLPADEQAHVLSRVKNDMLRAYMAVHFDKPISQPSVNKGKVNHHHKEALGAKALRDGKNYDKFIRQYIKNAKTDAKNQAATERYRERHPEASK